MLFRSAALQQATRTVSIVFVSVADPIAAGFVDSLARPGGNITGMSLLNTEISGKRLQLLRDMIPGVSRIAIVWNPDDPAAHFSMRETQTLAPALGFSTIDVRTRTRADFEPAFAAAAEHGAGAAVVLEIGRAHV